MVTIARWLGLLVLFVLALEFSARAEDWVRYRTPILSRFRDQSDLMVRDKDGAHGRPNSRYMKWSMNQLGLRGPEVTATKRPHTLRVITVGASETFGLYESPNMEYPRQLEDTLARMLDRNASCASRVDRVEVLNAGLAGMSLPTVEQDLRMRLGRLRPDVVVVYPTPAQYLTAAPPAPAAPDSSDTALQVPWTRALHLRSLDRLRVQAKQLLPSGLQTWIRRRQLAKHGRGGASGSQFDRPPLDRLALFGLELRRVVGSIHRLGADPVLVAHANALNGAARHDTTLMVMWQKFYPRASGDAIVEFDSLARSVVARVASDSQTAFFDPTRSLAGPGWFQDISHFTDAGAGRFAGSVASAVLAAAQSRLGCGLSNSAAAEVARPPAPIPGAPRPAEGFARLSTRVPE